MDSLALVILDVAPGKSSVKAWVALHLALDVAFGNLAGVALKARAAWAWVVQRCECAAR